MPWTFRLGAIAVVVTAVVACSGVTPTATPSTAPTPTPVPSASASAGSTPSVAPGASVAVVKIAHVGGFLPPWVTINDYPTVVLYDDGRLIMQGPQIEIYPGPALPNMQVTQLTPAGVEQILAWAADAGLEGEDRFLGQPVPDAGVTQFSVVQPSGPHTTSVADMSSDAQEVGALRRFEEIMLDIRQWLPNEVVGDDTPYEYDRLRTLSSPKTPADMPDPALVTVTDWPLAEPLATFGSVFDEGSGMRCAEVSGEDLAALKPVIEQANELTLWRSEGETYSVALHPLLPDEEGCPA
jgi:hypothetical protein